MIKKRENCGITLIALVITIIILLILAGISISALTQTGLFGKAKQAKEKSEAAQNLENETLKDYESKVNEYLTGTGGSSSEEQTPAEKTALENAESAKPNGATIIVTDASQGIVMIDSKNNEWVWVEVPKTIFTNAKSADEYNNIKTDLIAYASTYRGGSNWTDEWYAMDGETLVTASTTGLTDTQKTLSNGCGLTYNEYKTAYEKMLSSVYTNRGFWISRYEIGDSTSTNNNYAVRTSKSGTTGTAVSKADQIPYNFVTCSEAQGLASGMSTDTNKTSSLLFGIQWDLVCKFLQEKGGLTVEQIKGGDGIGSTNWGNYHNSSLTLYRGKYNINPGSSTSVWTPYGTDTTNYVTSSKTSNNESYSQLLTTGASEETKKMNIYDFAGNQWEFTLEKTSNTSKPCVPRGGNCYGGGSSEPAASRGNSTTTYSVLSFSFRSALY